MFPHADSVMSATVVALYFAIPRGRASPTHFATGVATVLVVLLALVQEAPASQLPRNTLRV